MYVRDAVVHGAESRFRCLCLHDVLGYREKKRVDRRSRLDEMTSQATEDALYEVDTDTCREALTKASVLKMPRGDRLNPPTIVPS